jgi:hypothetical protein
MVYVVTIEIVAKVLFTSGRQGKLKTVLITQQQSYHTRQNITPHTQRANR